MKVRWTGESLRLRITPAELAALLDGRDVREGLALPGGRWDVRLTPGGSTLAARSDGPVVHVEVPAGDLVRLTDDDCEGVYHYGAGLRLMVEKDFPCAHPHAPEAREPETERFAPTEAFLSRKRAGTAPDAHRDVDAG